MNYVLAVFLVFSLIAKNASQKTQSLTRGGRLTVVGSGGSTELPISAGGLLAYVVPDNKKAIVRGNITVTDLGSQAFIQVEVFDTASGRLMPIVRISTVGVSSIFTTEIVKVGTGVPTQEIQIHGDTTPNDGVAEWFADITELPI